MLEQVKVEPKSLDAYRPIVGEAAIDEILRMAEPLRGARVVMINATAFGGGVAEILGTLVPLMRDAGLDTEWQVIPGADEFFQVTKASHNGLQGMETPFTPAMQATWRQYNQLAAERFEGQYDFVFVHDPQPAGLLTFRERAGGRYWIWRCHIDTSSPNPAFWDFYAPYINAHDAAIFTLKEFVGPGVRCRHVAIIPPAIDPLAPKNLPVSPEEAQGVVSRFGLDPARPLVTQVSRFDPWKDPMGVIDSYRAIKREVPEVQLALVGSMAADDPEGWQFLDRTTRHAGEDFDIAILHNFNGVNAREVACFQQASEVVIQKSTREGFGLVVAEALWKGVPVVGGSVGGIPLQVVEGETGFLVNSPEACAERVLDLLRDPARRTRFGQKGREHVRQHFLTTRLLLDDLKLFRALESDPS
ncbi:MAG: glycosyltransferase [Anaerolineales bacterium]